MVQLTKDEELHPYLKPTGKPDKPWQLFDAAKGCKPVENKKICLSNDKAPPSKTKEKPKKEETFSSAPPPPKDKGWSKLFNDIQKPAKTPPKEKEPPPPFDIRDIPIAMKALNFPMGAKFSQKWLDGRAYVSSGPDAIYAADMIDKTSVTMDWLLKYKDIKANYDLFVKNDVLLTDKSKSEMKKRGGLTKLNNPISDKVYSTSQ